MQNDNVICNLVGELIPVADENSKGLHPKAKFSQSDDTGITNIDNINILSTVLWNGNVPGVDGVIWIVKTYPASPSYMYQEAFCMYPLKRYWRAKVDNSWREWIEV